METLTEDDLDRLTKIENQLIRFRKREAANTNYLCYDFGEAIEKVHELRQRLQGRFGKDVDTDVDGSRW